ncbi:Ger(x)C family spore germination protein [Brevibacillus laterosporus]|uniref:Ger(X)C family spore germination protein n=1 Tax=Brevibacillus laterosporus TaxID=1465 RepID=A0A502HAX8_BRELA|nr:Ger(x)C family spore germination protein [Brevibacillus laterosporus]QDX92859.1 Ger(x)C family spore germination protein [Brevibacillus laterosporus]TPG71214.1 Ger(x)C family spore germination protein [Brevibacillus laterosporus]TPG82463.1 Ger(x)C family spore germination protein [Brevibacillus laterosporus]
MPNKTNKHNWLACVLTLSLTLLISGCWDRQEIEDLAMVIGVGVDTPLKENDSDSETNADSEEASSSDADSESAHQGDESNANQSTQQKIPILLTHQNVVPKVLTGTAKVTGTQKQAYFNISGEGTSFFEIIRNFSTKSSKPPFFLHVKTMVIGEDFARKLSIEKTLEYFLRDTELRRTVLVVVAKGRALDVLNKKPLNETLPAIEILSILDNVRKNLAIATPTSLGFISEHMTTRKSFMIPRVEVSTKTIKIAGASLIKGDTGKMIGWLNEEEVSGANLLLGSGKSKWEKHAGLIKTVLPPTNSLLIYEIRTISSKITPKVQNGQVSFSVHIKLNGRIGEDWSPEENGFDDSYLVKTEKAFEKKIKELTRKSLNKLQKKWKIDVLEFNKALSVHHPDVWEKMKDNWDEEFSKIPIDVHVKVNVREFGLKGSKR